MTNEETYEYLIEYIVYAEMRLQDAEDDLTQARYRLEEFEQEYKEQEQKI